MSRYVVALSVLAPMPAVALTLAMLGMPVIWAIMALACSLAASLACAERVLWNASEQRMAVYCENGVPAIITYLTWVVFHLTAFLVPVANLALFAALLAQPSALVAANIAWLALGLVPSIQQEYNTGRYYIVFRKPRDFVFHRKLVKVVLLNDSVGVEQ